MITHQSSVAQPAATTAPTGAYAARCRSEAIRPSINPADVATLDTSAPAASAVSSSEPYCCQRCGSLSPYAGRKPCHRGGRGCKACSAVVDAIYIAQMTVYRTIAADAYKPGVGGATKTAILKRALDESSDAWRAALAYFGVGVGTAGAVQ